MSNPSIASAPRCPDLINKLLTRFLNSAPVGGFGISKIQTECVVDWTTGIEVLKLGIKKGMIARTSASHIYSLTSPDNSPKN